MQKITDLDVVAGPDKQVRLGGRVYRLPPDLPVELFLRINQFAEAGGENASDASMVQTLYGELLSLFQHRDPSVKSLPIGMNTLVAAIGQIYGDQDESAAGESTPARPTRRAGTKSGSKPKAPAKSRSSK